MSILWVRVKMWLGQCKVYNTYVVVLVEDVGGVGAGEICR